MLNSAWTVNSCEVTVYAQKKKKKKNRKKKKTQTWGNAQSKRYLNQHVSYFNKNFDNVRFKKVIALGFLITIYITQFGVVFQREQKHSQAKPRRERTALMKKKKRKFFFFLNCDGKISGKLYNITVFDVNF